MQKSVLLAVFALILVASANSQNGNIISRRLVGKVTENQRNIQATSTTSKTNSTVINASNYISAQYCSYTKQYYYSKAYICPQLPIYGGQNITNMRFYTSPQYCSSTKTQYYDRFFVCPVVYVPPAPKWCSSTQTSYLSSNYYCPPTYPGYQPSYYPDFCSSTGEQYYSRYYYCPLSDEYEGNQESDIIGPIIGGIVGGIVLIIVLIVICRKCCCKKNDKNQPIQVAVPQEQKPMTQPAEMPQAQICQYPPQFFGHPIMIEPQSMMMQQPDLKQNSI